MSFEYLIRRTNEISHDSIEIIIGIDLNEWKLLFRMFTTRVYLDEIQILIR